VVLAAGMGRRFQGDKQLAPMGPTGELLSDYNLHDALAAGAGRAVFVVRPDLLAALQAHHARWRGVELRYAVQSRPLGTTDAVLTARPGMEGPLVVVNADDLYGREAFVAAAEAVRRRENAVVSWRLVDTYSPAGGVSRALLEVDVAGWLTEITEGRDLTAAGPWPPGQPVSMNCWVFTAEALPLLGEDLAAFRARTPEAECPLPESVGRLVAAGRLRIRVLPAGRLWLGVTHPEDVPGVQRAIAGLIGEGRYPESLPGR
jgi:CTP:molybdopterin cytidylyltransferase MocA